MKSLRLAVVFVLYINFVFQTMIWSYDYLPWYVSAIFFLFYPTIVAVPFYLLFDNVFDDERGALFVGAGVVMVLFVGATIYVSRTGDYVRNATGRVRIFDGTAAELGGADRFEYYSIADFHLKNYKNDEIGAFYSSYRKNSSTTYSKTFAFPVFDSAESSSPRAFLCDSVSKSIQLDNGAGGPYGFDQTALGQNLPSTVIHAKLVNEQRCRGAAERYLSKKGLPPIDDPLTLEFTAEPAEEYYRTARVHFWIVTAILNLLAGAALVFALRTGETV